MTSRPATIALLVALAAALLLPGCISVQTNGGSPATTASTPTHVTTRSATPSPDDTRVVPPPMTQPTMYTVTFPSPWAAQDEPAPEPASHGALLPANSTLRAPHPVNISGRLTAASWAGSYTVLDRVAFDAPAGVTVRVAADLVLTKPDGKRVGVQGATVTGARVEMRDAFTSARVALAGANVTMGDSILGWSLDSHVPGAKVTGRVKTDSYEGEGTLTANGTAIGVTLPGQVTFPYAGRLAAVRGASGGIAFPGHSFEISGMTGNATGTFRGTFVSGVEGVDLYDANLTLNASTGAFTLVGTAIQLWGSDGPRVPCVLQQGIVPTVRIAPGDNNVVVRLPFRVTGPGSSVMAKAHAPRAEDVSFGPTVILEPGETLPDEYVPNFFPFLDEFLGGTKLYPERAYEVAFRAGNSTLEGPVTVRVSVTSASCAEAWFEFVVRPA